MEVKRWCISPLGQLYDDLAYHGEKVADLLRLHHNGPLFMLCFNGLVGETALVPKLSSE